MPEGRYTRRPPIAPSGYVSSLQPGAHSAGFSTRELFFLEVKGQQEAQAALESVAEGMIYQVAMQSKMAAKAILADAKRRCPEKTGALKSTGKAYPIDIMESSLPSTLTWPRGMSATTFDFNQAQRTVWEVSFGGETPNGVEVDYAALIHENPLGWKIHPDVNPEAEDHWLVNAYKEFEPYFSKRIAERLQKQIVKAAWTPGPRSTKPRLVKKTPVYDDEVPF